MTTKEFSDQFDVLYNNITSNQAPGLNEYEKSVFLTKAQQEIVKNYFSAEDNPKNKGFDDSPKRQADFSTLIREGQMRQTGGTGFDRRTTTKRYTYPEDVFIVLNEQVMDDKYTYVVVPTSYSEYDRLMSKPYKYPPKYQAWRLITNKAGESTSTVTVAVPGYASYTIPTWGGGDQTISYKNVTQHPVRLWVEVENPSYPADNKVMQQNTGGGEILFRFIIPTDQSFPSFKATYIDAVPSVKEQVEQYLSDLHLPTIDTVVPAEPGYICKLEAPAQTTTTQTVTNHASPIVELIGRFFDNLTYSVRYVRKPNPIVLVRLDNIGDELSIEDVREESPCELPEHLHEEILQRAVELAKAAWAGDQEQIAAVNMHTTMGQRSE